MRQGCSPRLPMTECQTARPLLFPPSPHALHAPSHAQPGSCHRGCWWLAGSGAAGSPPAGRHHAWSQQTPVSGPEAHKCTQQTKQVCYLNHAAGQLLGTGLRLLLNPIQLDGVRHDQELLRQHASNCAERRLLASRACDAAQPQTSTGKAAAAYINHLDTVQHRLALLVLLHVLHMLSNEVCRAAHTAHSQEDVVVQEVCMASKPKHNSTVSITTWTLLTTMTSPHS